MKKMVLIFAVLLASCATQPPVSKPPQGVLLESTSNGGATEAFDQISRIATAVKQYATATGQALADQIVASAASGKANTQKVTDGIAQSEKQHAVRESDLKKKLDASEKISAQKDIDWQKKVDKAEADGRSWLIKALYACDLLGLFGFVGCLIAYEQTSFKLCEYIAMGGLLLIGCSVTLSAFVTVVSQVTPIIAICVGSLIVTATLCAIGIIIYESIKRGKTVVETELDSLGSKQPTVAFPADVKKVVTALVGSAAASVEPPKSAPNVVVAVAGKTSLGTVEKSGSMALNLTTVPPASFQAAA